VKRVVTETVRESRWPAAESRRAATVRPVTRMSEAGTDRAADKPVVLADL